MEPAPPRFIHGTAMVIEGSGIVIRGASGSGKSSLALLLLAEADRRGQFGRLVGDDRIAVQAVDGRIVARPHAAIAGLLECRMVGLVPVAFEPACIVRLIVDLADDRATIARLPPAEDCAVEVEGVPIPRLCLAARPDALSCQLLFRKLFPA